MSDLQIEIKGLDKVLKAFDKFPREVKKTLAGAGRESSKVILKTKGITDYPPAPPSSQPPAPYYKRGTGYMYAGGGTRGDSEDLGKSWYVESQGFSTKIGTKVSYAKWVHGEEQARWMGPIGWRKLLDVAKEKSGKITKVYQAWINRLIKQLRL